MLLSISSGYVLSSMDHMIIPFLFLRNNHIVSHRGYAILHSHQQCTRVPVSTPSLPTLVNFYLKKKKANLMSVRRYLIVVVMKLVISHNEHLFLPCGCFYIFGEMSTESFAHYFKFFCWPSTRMLFTYHIIFPKCEIRF